MKTSKLPKAEIRLPISANNQYMRMVFYFLASNQKYGGEISRNARCVLSVSADSPKRDLFAEYVWLNNFNVEVRWVNPERFQLYGYHETGFDRYWVESDADVVLMMDADMLIAGNFDKTICRTHEEQKMRGMIAHVSPFWKTKKSAQKWWGSIYCAAGLRKLDLNYQHSAFGILDHNPDYRYCPIYYNYGFVASTQEQAKAIGRTIVQDFDIVAKLFNSGFSSQVAHTISLERHQIPATSSSINDNFALNVPAEAMRKVNQDVYGCNSDESIRIFHYLADGEVNKHDFRTKESFIQMLNRSSCSPSASALISKFSELVQEYGTIENPAFSG